MTTPNGEPVVELPADEPPSDGRWRDWDGAQYAPDVVAAGNELGARIDVEDDRDNGLGTTDPGRHR